MAITTGTSVSVMSGPVVPGQRSPVAPVLQAQDGSFVGTVWTTDRSQYMVAFDATGNVRWSVPGYCPQTATDDGGVIATPGSYCDPAGSSGAAVTFDQNGNAAGQVAGLTVYSWRGNAYQQQGSVEQISADLLFVLYDVASSFWAVVGGDYSHSATAYALVRTFSDNAVVTDIFVTTPSQTNPNQQTITSVLNRVWQSLNSGSYGGCSAWLTGTASVSAPFYINAVLTNQNYGHGVFNDVRTAAFVGGKNKDGTLTGVPLNFAFTVNDQGAFFNAKTGDKTLTVGRRAYNGGTLKAQAAILIHEFAHQMYAGGGAAGFQDDAGDTKKGRANDKLVDQYCGKLVGDLR